MNTSPWGGAFQAGRAILFVRNAFFFLPRRRYETILEISPDGAVFFQVDENSNLAALLIGDELDSGRRFIVFRMILER